MIRKQYSPVYLQVRKVPNWICIRHPNVGIGLALTRASVLDCTASHTCHVRGRKQIDLGSIRKVKTEWTQRISKI